MGAPARETSRQENPSKIEGESPSSVHELGMAFRKFANQEKFAEAGLLLEAFRPSSVIERRIREHYRAQLGLGLGNWKSAIESCGEPGDIVSCHHFLGNFSAWRASVKRLKEVFVRVESRVPFEVSLEVALSIVALLEQEGRVGEAILTLDSLMDRVREEEFPIEYHRCLVEQVRIKSIFGQIQGLAEAYQKLASLEDSPSAALKTLAHRGAPSAQAQSAQSALMLAELELRGETVARGRLRKILADPQASERAKRRVRFDFLESSWVKGSFEGGVQGVIQGVGEGDGVGALVAVDGFERALFWAGENTTRPSIAGELNRIASEISFIDYLRVLSVLLARQGGVQAGEVRHPYPEGIARIRQEFFLHLDALDPKSQEIWTMRIRNLVPESGPLVILWDEKQKSLSFGTQSVSFAHRPTAWRMVQTLVVARKSGRMSLEEAVRGIWAESLLPEHYNRVRMNARALNAVFRTLVGVPKAIRVRKAEIQWNTRLLFKRK